MMLVTVSGASFPVAIIQKEKRARTLYQNIVDAVIDEVAADGVVDSGDESDFQFRADAVGRGHQHRRAHLRKRAVEHPAKAADLREGARVESRAREFLDLLRGEVGGVDINTGIAISCGFHQVQNASAAAPPPDVRKGSAFPIRGS